MIAMLRSRHEVLLFVCFSFYNDYIYTITIPDVVEGSDTNVLGVDVVVVVVDVDSLVVGLDS